MRMLFLQQFFEITHSCVPQRKCLIFRNNFPASNNALFSANSSELKLSLLITFAASLTTPAAREFTLALLQKQFTPFCPFFQIL